MGGSESGGYREEVMKGKSTNCVCVCVCVRAYLRLLNVLFAKPLEILQQSNRNSTQLKRKVGESNDIIMTSS